MVGAIDINYKSGKEKATSDSSTLPPIGYIILNTREKIKINGYIISKDETLVQLSLDEYLARIKAKKSPDFVVAITNSKLADDMIFSITSDNLFHFPCRPFPIFMIINDLSVLMYKLNRICVKLNNSGSDYRTILSGFKNGIDFIDNNLEHIQFYGGKIIKFYQTLRKVTNSYTKIIQSHNNVGRDNIDLDFLQHLTELVETYDNHPVSHIRTLGRLAFDISKLMGLSEPEAKNIAIAVKLHDVGKLFIPKMLLGHRVEASTEQDWEVFHPHTRFGTLLVKRVIKNTSFKETVANVTLYHHENYNGSGYWGKSGDATPFEARLTRVLDVWDSLQRARPFRERALSFSEATEFITSKSKTHFDPEIVKVLKKVTDKNHGYTKHKSHNPLACHEN